jgi:peptide/nickel transport system permease protein
MIFSYVVKRLLQLIPSLLVLSLLVFSLVRMIPGDPVSAIAGQDATQEVLDEMREALGLNKPFLVQYGTYLEGLVYGDLGMSLRTRQPVLSEIGHRLPATMELAGAGILISLFGGIAFGILAALKPGNWADSSTRVVSLLGVSLPTFFSGLLFVLVFGYYLRLLPIAGRGGWEHLVLPALTISLTSLAFITRLTRASLLEVLSTDYIRTARAKGASIGRIIMGHALQNALIGPITVAGLEFGRLVSGVIVVETIFAWPGIGRYLIDAISFRDWPVIQGLILTFAVLFALVNLAVDVLYAVIDPRIRLD